MPYHGVAFEHEWDVLPHALQTLALALMRAAAGGALASALRCAVILLIPFRVSQVWEFWMLPASTLILSLCV
jgi:hypothetical protein